MATYAGVRVETVKDRAGFQRYLTGLPPLTAKFGGSFFVRGLMRRKMLLDPHVRIAYNLRRSLSAFHGEDVMLM
jgi:hypothetical protein